MRVNFLARPEPKTGWPALDERAYSASVTAEAALSTFDNAASDLEQAAAEYANIAFEAEDEIGRLRTLVEESDEAAERAIAQARAIRDMVAV